MENTKEGGLQDAMDDIASGYLTEGDFTLEGVDHMLRVTIGASREYRMAYLAHVKQHFKLGD